LEEVRGYELLIAEHNYTQREVADIVGRSRSHIANTMRLLSLPERTKQLLVEGTLSPGHARALLAVDEPDKVVDKIVRQGLTVRDVEKLGQKRTRMEPPVNDLSSNSITSDSDAKAWEHKLGLALGANVTLRYSGKTGEIRIAFRDLEQLEDLCVRLSTPIDR